MSYKIMRLFGFFSLFLAVSCTSLPKEPFEAQTFGIWGVSCSIDEKDHVAACRIINQRRARGEVRNYLEVKMTSTPIGLYHGLQPSIQGYWYRYQGPYADVVEVLSFRWGEKLDLAFLQVGDTEPLAIKDSSARERDKLVEQLLTGQTVKMWGVRNNAELVKGELDLTGFADAYRAGLAWLRPQ